MKELLRLLAVVGVLAAAAFGFVYMQQRKGYPLKVGEPAPAFELPRLDGAPTSLQSQRGRVVLVNLWASWCAPCITEMPSLQRLHEKLGPEGLVLIGVAADEDEKAIRDVIQRLSLTFPVLRDPDGRMAGAYRATGYPETYLIDKQGVLRATFVGPQEWDSAPVLGRLRSMLQGR
jgi:cytochrome c biogenesis protein CcmG, thiol:disulfide interchange protein DsbE